MPTLQLSPDLEMHYRVDDFTDPWREPETVLMLHGNAESGAVWYGWVPHLARRYRVVRPDMRGFGESTPMPRDFPWTLDLLIDDYVRVMDALARHPLSPGRRQGRAAPLRARSPRAGPSAWRRLPWSARRPRSAGGLRSAPPSASGSARRTAWSTGRAAAWDAAWAATFRRKASSGG